MLEIRPFAPEDRNAWEPLWQGYLTFYKSSLPPEVTDLVAHLVNLCRGATAHHYIGPGRQRLQSLRTVKSIRRCNSDHICAYGRAQEIIK